MASLIEVYATLFPDEPHGESPFDAVPRLPMDLFAFVGHVLERSGAYHHVVPDIGPPVASPFRRLAVTGSMRSKARRLGREWRETPPRRGRLLPEPPVEVERLWRRFQTSAADDVFMALPDTQGTPAWWVVSLQLLMIADEACRDIGFDEDNPFSKAMNAAYVTQDPASGSVFRRIQRAPFSISTAAEDVLCVQAKSRTPSVGCTLRSLTHHLALLPPRGQVRARWVAPPFGNTTKEGEKDLGLLLVPFPYRVGDDVFEPVGLDARGNWGWFDAKQKWLPSNTDRPKREAFVEFIRSLIREARERGERVDAVVLPELALNYFQFRQLARALARDGTIDFLIAGISRDQDQRPGNFVAIAPFFLLGPERSPDITGWEGLVLIREKHHRWKIDRPQIEAYALNLDPGQSWWENLSILSRSLDVLVYRGHTTLTTLTTLICEDLARVDPCQAVIRAIGPNLLIALLMDGPQFRERWPGRYATVLADDPGTSVLSFTSFGLIARQNDLARFPQASSIALWKDEVSGARSLELPREADALLLSLKATRKRERTLDGRTDGGDSHRWEYQHHRSVTSPAKPDWVRTGRGKS